MKRTKKSIVAQTVFPAIRGFDKELFKQVNKKRKWHGITWKELMVGLFNHFLNMETEK